MSPELPAYRRKRREAPLAFFRGFLRAVWRDNTEAEALEQWRQKVELFPDYAEDALYCMQQVLASPPPDLAEILSDEGWLPLYHDRGDEIADYSFEETVEFVQAMHARLEAIYAERAGS
ncbi:MAG: hypothetical protein JXR96_01615 [Deltaproteobacteria bacterium]|nr:hypothetical protein [Deltaproteobacteria bacterium]